METKDYDLEPDPREVLGSSDNDLIYISVRIGNGQIGGNVVRSGEKLLAKGNLSESTFIGKINDLKDEVAIQTNVLDVNSFTNNCVITTTFKNQDNQVLFTKVDSGEAPESGIATFRGKYLLKIITMIVIFFCFNNFSLLAQNESEKVTFESLETPSSPGLILIDRTPSSIEKPTTPQGFGLSMVGFIQGSGGAVDLTPFWLANHPNLTAKKMVLTRFPLLYTGSVSIADVREENVNYIAGGIRTRLFQKFGKSQIRELDTLKVHIENELSNVEKLDLKKIEKLRKQYVELTESPLFNIDLAAAVAGSTPDNSYKNLEMNRWAAWISMNWRPKGEDMYLTAVTRYISNEKLDEYATASDMIDLGARLNYDIDKFCISIEYLQRLNTTEDIYNDYRVAVIGSYRLSDNFFITSTFGKNFTQVNNIIALAGINFGFSKNQVKAF